METHSGFWQAINLLTPATSVSLSNLLFPLLTTGIGDFGLLTNNLISFLSVFPLYSLVYFMISLYYITHANLYNEIVLVLEVLQEAHIIIKKSNFRVMDTH
jgi:hypothetical protein